MGTNFYYYEDPEVTDIEDESVLHIGKSSCGWCFSLRVYPSRGIHDLEDWERKWDEGGIIRDEYEAEVPVEEMKSIITERSYSERDFTFSWTYGYMGKRDFLEKNCAVEGPNNLLRHKISPGFCIGHGEGTWDLLDCEFS